MVTPSFEEGWEVECSSVSKKREKRLWWVAVYRGPTGSKDTECGPARMETGHWFLQMFGKRGF